MNLNINNINNPKKYPDIEQKWKPNSKQPYPMNFVQAPSSTNQVLVYYNGKPCLQGLSTNKGPIMYPTTHSIAGPYLQSYININHRKMYMY